MGSLPGLKVVRSKIHGYGVIATRIFRQGEIIAEVDGIAWHEGELRDDTYALWIDDDMYFDMVDQTRWINHSCNPNSEVKGERDTRGGAWAHIVASRDIRIDEEITYDYGFPLHLAEPCLCGVPNCRRFIVAEEELPKLYAQGPQT